MTTMGDHVIIVPDTNVLLHSQPLDQVPWRDLAKAASVEIVLVSQVLRELDAKKNGESEKLRRRARNVLSKVNSWLPSASSTPTIAEGVTLRARVTEPRAAVGLDLAVPDDRVLASASELGETHKIYVATGDTTMRLKADSLGLHVVTIPDAYRIRDEEPKQIVVPKAQLRAGLLDLDGRELSDFVALGIGLSAKHLLDEANEGLHTAQLSAVDNDRTAYGRNAFRLAGFGSFYDEPEPGVEAWESYIQSIHAFDEKHANWVEVVVGVVNDGTAPAEDILVEFQFPPGIYVHRSEPYLPSRPRRRSHIDNLVSLVARPPHPMEVNESFHVDWDGDTGAHAQIKIRRLLQSKRIAYAVWAEIHNDSIGGIPIRARVLAGSPPLTTDSTLNVRFER
jgi:rRNA-processing protein FCF1